MNESFAHFHRRVGQVRSPRLVADNRGLCTYYLLHLRITARQGLCLDNTLGSWGFWRTQGWREHWVFV